MNETTTELIQIDDKYSIKITSGAKFKVEALRYGDGWRNLTGDNLILAMACKIQSLEKANE